MKVLMILAICILLILGCGGESPTTSTEPADYFDLVQTEWQIAQDILSAATDISERAYSIKWDQFLWVPKDGPFQVDGDEPTLADSYREGTAIYWNVHKPYLIRHEAAKAILTMLGHPCHKHIEVRGYTVYYDTTAFHSPFCYWWVNKYWGY